MSDSIAADSATSAPTGRASRKRTRHSADDIGSERTNSEGAGGGSSNGSNSKDLDDRQRNDGDGHSELVAIENRSAATSGDDRHVPDHPSEGAVSPRNPALRGICARALQFQLRFTGPPLH